MQRRGPIEQPKHTMNTFMPAHVVAFQQKHALLSALWLLDTGNYQRAKDHVCTRNKEEVESHLLIYCLRGEGWFSNQRERFRVTAGDVVLARAGVAYSYGADADEPWTIQWAYFNGADVDDLLRLAEVPMDGAVLQIGYQDRILAAFNDMLMTLQAGLSQHHLLVASGCLRYILNRIALSTSQPTLSKNDLAVERVLNLMRENIGLRYTLNDLANHADMPRSTFIRIFREKMGCPPLEYFLRLKVQRACELLERTDKSVGQISRQLGYDDQYYFSRLFKKFMNQSPQHYRS